MNVYDVGQMVSIDGIFTTRKLTVTELKLFRETGALPEGLGVDPADVSTVVIAPDNSKLQPATTGDDGIYTAEIEAAMKGKYQYAMYGKGSHQAAKRGAFKVDEPLPSGD